MLSAFGDSRLVEQARRGNEAAFEVIYDRHHGGVLSYCRHMLGSREEAEDALQHTFISAYDSLRRSNRPVAVRAWLYTIARNRCLSVLRARREHSSEEVEPSTAGLADEVERRAELRQLVADLAELPEEQRGALVLSELGGLTHADIAEVLGCEVARVKSLVFQARSALIESRRAREIPCDEIRSQLATLRGGSLRRGSLRRHVKCCPGCGEFREEVRRQRAMMASVLPVVPSLGLKESALAAIGYGGGGAAAAGGVGGLLSGGTAKIAVAAAIAGGGGVAVSDGHVLPARTPDTPAPAVAPAPAVERGASDRHAPAAQGRLDERSSAGGEQAETHGLRPLRRQSNGERARDFSISRGSGRHLGPARKRALGRSPATERSARQRSTRRREPARERAAPPVGLAPEIEALEPVVPVEPLPTDPAAARQLR